MKLLQITLIYAICSLTTSTYAFGENKNSESNASIEKRLATIQSLEVKGNISSAIAQIKDLFEEDSDHKELRINYASLLIKSNQADKAQEVIQSLVDKYSDDWRVWFWLGSSQLLQSDLENASNSFSNALALNGEEISVWVQKAITEQEKGNSKVALNLLQVANSIQPNNSEVLVNYAYVSEIEGEVTQAVELYRYFLKLSASDRTKGKMRSEVMLRLAQIASAQSMVNADIEDNIEY